MVNLPSSYFTEDEFKKEFKNNEREALVAYGFKLPDEFESSGVSSSTTRLVHSLIVASENECSVRYFHPEMYSWETIGEVTLNRETKRNVTHAFKNELYTFGEDAEATQKLRVRLGEKLRDIYGKPVFMYDESSAREIIGFDNPDECGCGYPKQPLPAKIEGGRTFNIPSCLNCSKPHSINYRGQNHPRGNIVTSLAEGAGKHTKSLGDKAEVQYGVIGESEILDRLSAFLAKETHAETAHGTTLEVGQGILFLRVNGVVVGYLNWSEKWGEPLLHQVYVTPRWRGKDYAERLLSIWTEQYIDSAKFYADEPSEVGRCLLSSTGYLKNSDESKSTAVEYRRFYPMIIEPNLDTTVINAVRKGLEP